MHPHRGFLLPIFKHCAKFAQCFFHAVLAQQEERQSPKPEAGGSMPPDGAIAEGCAYPVQDRILTANSV